MGTIHNALEKTASMYGMKAAFKFIVNEVVFEKSYIELNDDTKAFGSYLQKIYGKQNKIGLIGRTSYEWIVTYLGITRSQNIAVTLDYSLNIDALCEQIEYADVNLMFLSGEFEAYKDKIYEKCKKVQKIFTFDLASDMFYANYGLEEDFDETTVAQLIFTSGTTSKSKAVVLTHQNLMVVFEKTPSYTVNSRFRSLSILPLHHITELAFGIFHPLKSGTTICINDSIQKLMENMQVFKPHFMTVVPEILNKFSKIAMMYLDGVDISKVRAMSMDERRKMFQQFNRDIFGGHLRYLNIGGAKPDVEAMKLIELMGIYAVEGYASTEMSGCCVCNMAGFTKLGTCGKVHFEGTEIKLVDKELCVKGSNIMKEYYKNPEATKNAFTEDGYFKTGDLAEFDEDNNLIITGRKNDLIVLNNGENVSPEALQALIYKNEKVDKCVVYGYKNQLCVIIYVKEKTDSLCEEITQHIHNINNTLPNYKKIVDILFTTIPFEVTPKGSIKRNLVIARAISMHEEQVFVEAKTETEIKICNKVMELLHLNEKISITDSLFNLGIDSINVCELAASLDMNPQDIYNYKTVENIAKHLNQKQEVLETCDVNGLIAKNKDEAYVGVYDNYLLTGASGFLGAHILHRLVQDNKKVYCIVRNADRVRSNYMYYFNEELPESVEMLIGDIQDERFGLDADTYGVLVSKVKMIIHTAAVVKHVGDFDAFYKVNVTGTKNVIEFAKQSNAPIQYISSYSVGGLGLAKQNKDHQIFDENTLNISQDFTSNVYVHTKYLAEKELLLAREENVKANIYRVGSLTWSKDGIFQVNKEDNGIYNRLMATKLLGKYVVGTKDEYFDLTPIDECVDAFYRLMNMDRMNNIYHLYNPKMISISDFEKMTGEQYEACEQKDLLKLRKENSHPCVEFFANYMQIVHSFNDNVIICNETVDRLKETGFEWSEITKDYIELVVK